MTVEYRSFGMDLPEEVLQRSTGFRTLHFGQEEKIDLPMAESLFNGTVSGESCWMMDSSTSNSIEI